MIVSIAGSWFNVDGVSLSLNTAYVDSVFAFISEGTDITIYYNRVI